MELTLFGIKNCDTMKKAMKWLDDNGVAYHFHEKIWKTNKKADPAPVSGAIMV